MLANLLTFSFWLLVLLRQQSRFFVAPSGVHMAFTENANELSFVWSSLIPQWGSRIEFSSVTCENTDEWTSVEADWQWSFIRYSRTWEIVYKVVITGVYPDCRYQYRIGAGVVWTPIREFSIQTPYAYSSAAVSDLSHQTDFLVIGDMGNGPSSSFTRARLQESLSVDGLLHLGDIAYDLESVRPAISRAYFKEIEPITSVIPYMVLPGNHEISDGYVQYMADFRMPVNEANHGSSMFYSFNMGRAHFTVVCGEDLYHSDPQTIEKQLKWVTGDLTEANRHRETVPWLFVMMHRPLYCQYDYRLQTDEDDTSNKDCGFRALRLRKLLEELFFEQGVDIVLQAHVHNYQRTTPLYRNQTVPSEYDDFHRHLNSNAPIFLLCGAAGNREGNDPLSPTPQDWSVVQKRELSYGRLRVRNSTRVEWELRNSITDQVLDFLTVEKTRNRYGRTDED